MKKITTVVMAVAMFCLVSFNNAQAQDVATEFKPSGKVTGQVFADYQVKVHADSALRGSTQYAKVPTHFNSFEFRRIYLGYEYNFSEQFSAVVNLAQEGSNFDASGNRTFYPKQAFVKWKNFVKNQDIIFGQQNTNTYALLSEVIYGYRSIEKTITDQRGLAKSSDFGLAVQGRFNDAGDYGYNILVANNPSPSYGPETDAYKKAYLDLYGKFFNKHLVIDLYGDYERNTQPHPLLKDKSMMKLFIAYTSDPITICLELFNQKNQNYTVYKLASDTVLADSMLTKGNAVPMGWSVSVRAPIVKGKLGVFARYDSYDPDSKYSTDNKYYSTSTNGHLKETFLTAGLDMYFSRFI